MPYPSRPEIVLPHPWIVGEQRLRLPERKDVGAITQAAQTRDIQRFTRIPVPYVEADAEWFVAHASDQLDEGSGIHLLITDPPGQALYGACGLDLDWRDAVGEAGYWLHPNARGQGIVTRAVAELCRFGFGLGLARIQINTAVNNDASAAVARRLGFSLEGTRRAAGIDGDAGDPHASRIDMHVFGLLGGELVQP